MAFAAPRAIEQQAAVSQFTGQTRTEAACAFCRGKGESTMRD
jgi:hypothetical protein